MFTFIAFSLIISLTNAQSEIPKLIVVGDSLTEGYGVSREEAFPARLAEMIKAKKKEWVVVNSGISGSTAASGPSRVRWALRQKPRILILALGANDGLRGSPIEGLEKNLGEALAACAGSGTNCYLAGMQIPPNYGATYTREFREVFPRVAKKYGAHLIPFLLEGVGGQKEMNQGDQIHPNAKGHLIVAKLVLEAIQGDL